MHIDISPAPGRFPLRLSPRWTMVVLEPVPGLVSVFPDGELIHVLNKPAGEA